MFAQHGEILPSEVWNLVIGDWVVEYAGKTCSVGSLGCLERLLISAIGLVSDGFFGADDFLPLCGLEPGCTAVLEQEKRVTRLDRLRLTAQLERSIESTQHSNVISMDSHWYTSN